MCGRYRGYPITKKRKQPGADARPVPRCGLHCITVEILGQRRGQIVDGDRRILGVNSKPARSINRLLRVNE